MSDLVELLLTSPVGVSTLAELAARPAVPAWEELLEVVVRAAHFRAGPWMSTAPADLAEAYRHATERRTLAEHLAARLEDDPWKQALGPQEVWLDAAPTVPARMPPKFTDLSVVYGNGEFTFGGLWTVTTPPATVADELSALWEIYPGPVSRWRLPIREGARVLRIDGPEDWAALVARYPRAAARPHSGWELPGPNQHLAEVGVLLEVPGQHAVRTTIAGHLLPDWEAVSADVDGVHLSWRGFVTTEGRIIDLPDGAVTMLRYWGGERTLWLRPVFGDPAPLGLPLLHGDGNGADGVGEPPARDRTEQDRRKLAHLLGSEGS